MDEAFRILDADLPSTLHNLSDSQTLYESIKVQNNGAFVRILLQHFVNIHTAACETQRLTSEQEDENLLPISLHDMKHLENLIRLIVIHGIDSNLPVGLELPSDLKNVQSREAEACPRSMSVPDPCTLELVIQTLYPIFQEPSVKDDYVRAVILKGPLYTSVLLAIISLETSKRPTAISNIYDSFEDLQQTYELFSIYTLLVRSIKNGEAQSIILEKLSTLPVRRENGLLSLIDFITGAREDENIDINKIDRVTQVLVAKPKSLTSVAYFSKLFTQVYEELSYINRPVVINCLNNLIYALYQKNHRIIRDFLFKKIYSVLFNMPLKDHSSVELNKMINVLISLTKNPAKDLVEDLVIFHDRNSFYLHLWVYALFLRKYQKIGPNIIDAKGEKHQQGESEYYGVILSLLKTFIILTGHFEIINILSLNMVNFQHEKWRYLIDFETQLAYISVGSSSAHIGEEINLPGRENDKICEIFQNIDLAIDLFVELLRILNNESVIKDAFLGILSRWVKKNSLSENVQISNDNSSDSILILIDMKALESLNKEFGANIIKEPKDILLMLDELIEVVFQNSLEDRFQQETDSDDEEDMPNFEIEKMTNGFEIIIELLTTICQNSDDRELLPFRKILLSINNKLSYNENSKCIGLRRRITEIVENKAQVYDGPNDSYSQDRSTLEEAMSNISDPLEPIKVQGLKQLLSLVQNNSTVITIDRVSSLYLQCLKHSDPFIYLNAIKGLTKLCQINPQRVLPSVLEIYMNLDKKNKLDDVLKIGEVLIMFIQRENELFLGMLADSIINACITQVRSRDILDNKIRMSAMSVLGICLETNAQGVQSRIAEILDCAFGSLQLETQLGNSNSFLIRRASIRLIHDLLNKSGTSLLPGQYSCSKLLTILSYVHHSDTDSLVREQAGAILSELQMYQMQD